MTRRGETKFAEGKQWFANAWSGGSSQILGPKMSSSSYDVTVIGGGIIGTATAMRLSKAHPQLKIGLIEKESAVAAHQTGNNSGVIHSGIYYAPGSLKAQNCVTGVGMLEEFCHEHDIEYELCGKVIVATSEDQLPRLDELFRRGQANGVPGLEIIDASRLREIEPHVAGIKALHSPNTGIIDYSKVTRAYAAEIAKNGGEIQLGTRLNSVETRADVTTLMTSQGEIKTRYLINCGGLYSDVVARMMGLEVDVRIIPFRGEYFMLQPDARRLVNGLIYPVPDPRFPFLGPHFTRTIHGGVEAGPNAVLALAREGYTKTKVNPREVGWTLAYGGFWRMAFQYWNIGLREVQRSVSKGAFTRALQVLIPQIRQQDLQTGGAGVRAQAVDAAGRLIDDFRIVEAKSSIHVLNAPSPGATASLAISADIATRAQQNFDL